MKAGKAFIEAIKKADVYKIPEKKPKSAKPPEPQEYYWPPSLYLSTKDFPGIKDWKAGDTVQLVITAKVGIISITEKEKGENSYSTDLTITSIADVTPKAGGGK